METGRLKTLLNQLDGSVDDLGEVLGPLLKLDLAESAAKLPLLDQAKLYIFVTYAIENLLFSFLRLQGVDARQHPVFRELTRVKQYYEKIKAVEMPAQQQKRNLTLDKEAAKRFIQPALKNGTHLQQQQQQQQQRQATKNLVLERSKGKLTKFEEPVVTKKRKADAAVADDPSSDSSSSSDDESSAHAGAGESRDFESGVTKQLEVEIRAREKKLTKRLERRAKQQALKEGSTSDLPKGNAATSPVDASGVREVKKSKLKDKGKSRKEDGKGDEQTEVIYDLKREKSEKKKKKVKK